MHIGTSGWTYPHWVGPYYPVGTGPRAMLAWYARDFGTVEINHSFYRMPLPHMLKTWRETTPPDFLFAIKVNRYLTHRLRLQVVAQPLVNFVRRAVLLGPKLGPLLLQFPETFRCDPARLAAFAKLLPERLRFAFEFRHASWFCDEVYAALADHGAALVLADAPDYPVVEQMTADFVYARLHGGEVLYRSPYTVPQLERWRDRIRGWCAAGRDVYVYFDNDFLAFAPDNAKRLRDMVLS